MAHFEHQGLLLKKKRIDSGFTQIELADVLGNVHNQFVSNWERGLCAPPAHCLQKLIGLLKIDRAEMVKAMLIDSKNIIESKVYPKAKRNKVAKKKTS